ncbi:hypothetical protein PENTCL1PPCAC_16010, partial [Pristionchus entomophagus]
VVGVFTNVLLLYVIRRHTRSPLGAYKHLLTTFATVDLLLTVIHLVVEPRDGYEDPRYILTLFLFDVAMVCSLSMAVTLGVRTFIGIRQQRVISENKTKIELKLLITATAQTLVPFIFVYVPYFCCLNFPCFILPVETLADLCMFLTSCFPVYDAVIVIVLMKDYRHAVIGMVTRRRSVVPPSATVTPSYITTTV